MHSEPFYEVRIKQVTTDQQEMLIGICAFLDVEALEQREDEIIIYSPDQKYITNLIDDIKRYASWLSDTHIVFSTTKALNWNKQWESSFEPIVVEDFCAIRASWHQPDNTTNHEIIIDPEMAFGTGHHETTFMMIQQMRHLNFTGKKVLDLGSGTAILSILGDKLGADDILAIDHDPQATRCAQKCLVQNRSNKVQCQTATISDISADNQYDIILANINRKVLLSSGKEIMDRLQAGGDLLLSGILMVDKEIVLDYYQKIGFHLKRETSKGDWICLLLQG